MGFFCYKDSALVSASILGKLIFWVWCDCTSKIWNANEEAKFIVYKWLPARDWFLKFIEHLEPER